MYHSTYSGDAEVYYRLDDQYAFRGWKYLPYAITAISGEHYFERPTFFNREQFMTLLSCNGEECICEEELNDSLKKMLEQLTEEGVLHSSGDPMDSLRSIQRYHCYPGVYLTSVHWSITGKCNYKCRHCLVCAPNGSHQELPLDDILEIVDQLAKNGIKEVDLTGGEPLVRSDFMEIVKSLSEHGIRIRVLFSNGSLVTEQLLDEMERYGQHPAFQLSYDGRGHHDWLRGIPGAEERLLQTIKLLEKRNYQYSCAMCIHRENKESLAETVRYLAEHKCMSLSLNTPQKLGLWNEYADEYAMTQEETWETYSRYIDQYFMEQMPISILLDGFFECKAGSTKYRIPYVHHMKPNVKLEKIPFCESIHFQTYIDAEGRLVPCMGMADHAEFCMQFPYVLESGFGESTWNSNYASVSEMKLSDVRARNEECRECEHFNACGGGCMAAGMEEDAPCGTCDRNACWFHKNLGEEAVRAVAEAAIAEYVKVKEESRK